ncbi:FAD/NAD(P)-binding protein [Amycolatopsis pigmentata]|uniref:FAD/NAD(P)-binding protein n=1 Tax=Amycolatopsis pigmentata TaxID=450801 RepID=A0ABW5FPW3_9PSEU
MNAEALPDMVPTPYRVSSRVRETADSVTLCLKPVRAELPPFRAGQFIMLYAHGRGEVAISISGDPSVQHLCLTHTIRAVGPVSQALHDAGPGTVLGARGPFGTDWDIGSAAGRDLVVVAGGVGLAPLRPVVLSALARRDDYRRVVLIAGARTPEDFLFRTEFRAWADGIEVVRTIDRPAAGWDGPVGFVTAPLAALEVDPGRTTAFVCGPEPMMRFCAKTLLDKGVPATGIRVSLERNMQCGIGTCGHCQLGPLLLCRDGPVVGYDIAGPLLNVREL